jgi:hypothetical protein
MRAALAAPKTSAIGSDPDRPGLIRVAGHRAVVVAVGAHQVGQQLGVTGTSDLAPDVA